MFENQIKLAPNTVVHADEGKNMLVVEFAIPGAPTDTIDLKILPDSVHLGWKLDGGPENPRKPRKPLHSY